MEKWCSFVRSVGVCSLTAYVNSLGSFFVLEHNLILLSCALYDIGIPPLRRGPCAAVLALLLLFISKPSATRLPLHLLVADLQLASFVTGK